VAPPKLAPSVKQPLDRQALNLSAHCGRYPGLTEAARFTHTALQLEQLAADAVAADANVSAQAVAIAIENFMIAILPNPFQFKTIIETAV